MKLLICTQKIDKDDPILGFFHSWVLAFAKQWEGISIICLEEGRHDFPANVSVFSLGKERGAGRILRLINFYKYIWRMRAGYDAVFVHMNPEYVVLGGLFWRAVGKKVGLWYTHKSVTWKLRIAEKLTCRIFTASPESFRLQSKKVFITGHGIDASLFVLRKRPAARKDRFYIGTAGRITPVKNLHLIIGAMAFLKRGSAKNVELRIAGAVITKDDARYKNELDASLREYQLENTVTFIGAISHDKMPDFYREIDLFVNLSGTGSIDKSVLEAFLSGCLVLTSNEAFRRILAPYELLFLAHHSVRELTERIARLSEIPVLEKNQIVERIRKDIVKNHSLETLVRKLTEELSQKKRVHRP